MSFIQLSFHREISFSYGRLLAWQYDIVKLYAINLFGVNSFSLFVSIFLWLSFLSAWIFYRLNLFILFFSFYSELLPEHLWTTWHLLSTSWWHLLSSIRIWRHLLSATTSKLVILSPLIRLMILGSINGWYRFFI